MKLLFQGGRNETSLFNMKEEILRKAYPECNEVESKGSGRAGGFSLVIKEGTNLLQFDLVDGFALESIVPRNPAGCMGRDAALSNLRLRARG